MGGVIDTETMAALDYSATERRIMAHMVDGVVGKPIYAEALEAATSFRAFKARATRAKVEALVRYELRRTLKSWLKATTCIPSTTLERSHGASGSTVALYG
jgi:hypothetical protein